MIKSFLIFWAFFISNNFIQTELNYKVEFTHIDTSYEPTSISYSEMFSWQGEEFPKRTNNFDEIIVRRKRSSNSKKKSTSVVEKQLMSESFLKAMVTPEEGVFIIVENVTIIDEYLYGSPRMPFRANRRIFVIAIIKPEEKDFDKRVKKIIKTSLARLCNCRCNFNNTMQQ